MSVELNDEFSLRLREKVLQYVPSTMFQFIQLTGGTFEVVEDGPDGLQLEEPPFGVDELVQFVTERNQVVNTVQRTITSLVLFQSQVRVSFVHRSYYSEESTQG